MLGLKNVLALSLHVMWMPYTKMTGKLKASRCEAIDAAEIKPAKYVSSIVLTRSLAKVLTLCCCIYSKLVLSYQC